MSEDVADYVAIEYAGKVADISPRTLRHWVKVGKLPAIPGKRGKLVSMREVERLAALVGKEPGKEETDSANPARSADTVAGNVADSLAESSALETTAGQQLAAIRDQWLAPLVAQIAEQAERIGRLEAEKEDLRRRAEVAEASLVDLRHHNREDARNRAQAAQAIVEGQRAPRGGLTARLGRWWRGERREGGD